MTTHPVPDISRATLRSTDEADVGADTPRRRGRPRDARIDETVLRATLELIGEGGVARLSMDQVAHRAGVGKATIYRRWDSKETLLLDALRSAVHPLELEETGSLRGDLELFGRRVIERYHTNTLHDVLPHLIEAGYYDEVLRAEVDDYLRYRQRTLRTILERAAERGELHVVEPRDIDVLISAILGALTYRMMLTHEPLDDHFITVLLDIVL